MCGYATLEQRPTRFTEMTGAPFQAFACPINNFDKLESVVSRQQSHCIVKLRFLFLENFVYFSLSANLTFKKKVNEAPIITLFKLNLN